MNNKTFVSVIIIILFIGAIFAFNKIRYNKEGTAPEKTMTSAQKQNSNSAKMASGVEVVPVEHATMVLKWGGKVIYTDPVGGVSAFTGEPAPDLILLTDIR